MVKDASQPNHCVYPKADQRLIRHTVSIVLMTLGTLPLPLFRDLGAAGLLGQTLAAFTGLLLLTGYSTNSRSLVVGVFVLATAILSSLPSSANVFSGQVFFLVVLVFATSIARYRINASVFGDRFVLLLFVSVFLALGMAYLTASETLHGRLKILSSATTSALICSLIVMLGVHHILLLHGRSKYLYRAVGVAMVLLGMFFIFAIQSRGALMSAVFFVQFMLFVYRKASLRGLAYANVIALLIFVPLLIYLGEDTFARFNFANFGEAEAFLSGRSQSYLILESYLWDLGFIQYFFGSGYGFTFQYLQSAGLEVPHLDMLVYFTDGGFVGLFIYLMLLYRLRNFGLPYFVSLFFFLNGLHTNMHLWPNLIPATIVLSCYLDAALKRVRARSLTRRETAPRRASGAIGHGVG